ncbi:hypothetical protein KEM55_005421 [Ascosphaera atra]|nr:hypothetical protein KEM55_005421 [Ascosphaera atra]
MPSEPLDDRMLEQIVGTHIPTKRPISSEGTYAHNPNKTATDHSLVSRPWRSASLISPARLRGNGTKNYYRDEVFNVEDYPWSTIGRLFFSRFDGDRGGWCTATLVGNNIILTASHCFPWGYGRDKWMRFVPSFGNGTEPYGSSYVSRCRGFKNSLNVTGTDYVVCELCQPLGDKVGWMGTHWWPRDSIYKTRTWKSSGYPVDSYKGNSLMLLSDLRVEEVHSDKRHGKEIETRVFASPGWSGGPLWEYIDGEPRIIGICSGGERACSRSPDGCEGLDLVDDYHDVSAGGQLMTALVRQATEQWHTPVSPPAAQNSKR